MLWQYLSYMWTSTYCHLDAGHSILISLSPDLWSFIMMENQQSAWALPLALEHHLNMAIRETDLDKST